MPLRHPSMENSPFELTQQDQAVMPLGQRHDLNKIRFLLRNWDCQDSGLLFYVFATICHCFHLLFAISFILFTCASFMFSVLKLPIVLRPVLSV